MLSYRVYFTKRNEVKRIIYVVCRRASRPAPVLAAGIVNGFHVVYISVTLQQTVGKSTLILSVILNTSGNVLGFLRLRNVLTVTRKRLLTKQNNVVHEKSAVDLACKRRILMCCEELVLIEYLECIVPLMFLLFSVYYYFHPNRINIKNV